ncbi:zinc ABC transporter permease AztB [Herbiconiux flava]|uniref:Zinc/manganese transport system permease protein/manganese/iron transport system permease protein n=1 Tax=Herbiconiux flava TaxID=881268 RepID=A0A852SBP6_9MICO|nr:zinc ABC transporter permease AztB [Herbiconiux flava]NYD69822.1 zinc/manganese transport system permease protein/manganese/iron transport system permease protein [Herbiconiux flava]GLK16571.1 hypothetical protein GCM10017602_10530 [Herbiconiux flava]
MTELLEPFAAGFLLRALVGGVLVAVLCGVVGTWVVIRGMAFLGEAMAHGVLPGVAVATLLGLPPVVGAAVSASVMTAGIGVASRRGRLSDDTAIGLLFVAMLSLGVIVVSRSRSFATDLTAILFGDVLAISWGDIALLAGALLLALGVCAVFHRSFVAATFDERIAATLGLRPWIARPVLVGLVTLVVVASYQAVGSLLVVGLLLGPAVAAGRWVRSIPATMALAAALGALAVLGGLLVSWHAATAAGATIAAMAALLTALSALARALLTATTARRATRRTARRASGRRTASGRAFAPARAAGGAVVPTTAPVPTPGPVRLGGSVKETAEL